MSANRSETQDVRLDGDGSTVYEILVSRAEVDNFLQLLKGYSDSCAGCKAEVSTSTRAITEAVVTCQRHAVEYQKNSDLMGKHRVDSNRELTDMLGMRR